MAFKQNTRILDEPEPKQDQEPGGNGESPYSVGQLAGLEWSPVPNAKLDDSQKAALKTLKVKAAKRDYPARLVEVIQAWEPLDVLTPIATPCGWKTMGSLRAGDYVFGSNGRIASVTYAHPIQEQKSYSIFFSDGSSIIAGEKHSWMTTTCKERSAGRLDKERTTKELFETQDCQHAIRMMPGLQTFDTQLPIDPYMLGCWLGDGIAKTGEICGCQTDLSEIISYSPGAKIRKKVSRAYGDYCLATVKGLRDGLYRIGLLGNKHIPKIYLRASFEQRLALLQGLMDTDGWATTNGGCGWGQFKGHRALIDGFSELLSTLGIKHQFYAYHRKREDGESFEFWQTTFYSDLACFRLKRKSDRQQKLKGKRAKLLYITGIEEVGVRNVRCITVDTPDHLFLAGKSMVPTHNCALFYRGFQFLIPQRGGGWIIPGESTGYGPTMQMDLALLPTNIYSARAQMIIAALTRVVPGVRFAPQDPNSDAQITAAESADKFVKVIKRNNDLIMIQTDAARYLWTDGRFGYWSRFVKDGQKFGWEEDDEPDDIVPEDEPEEAPVDVQASLAQTATEGEGEGSESFDGDGGSATPGELFASPDGAENATDVPGEEEAEEPFVKRTPHGQEVRSCHGKLEMKIVPMMANDQCDVDVIILEMEVDLSRARGMFPWVADNIRAAGTGTADGEIAKLARQNVKLGMQSTYVTSDSIAEDVTIQRVWFRPSYFMHLAKDKREELIEMFPNGCLAVWAGETFCYARNESMDDSWALGQAYSGDGQNRNAMGTSTMPIQKRLNNWLDLMNDLFVRGVPKKWMDSKAFNVDAIRGQTNIPGDIGGFKRQPGVPVAELIFIEPQISLPLALPDFIQKYSGELAELLSGAYPALAGGDVGSADSGVAIATQRDSALGRLAPTWHAVKHCEAKSMKQLIRWGAKCRDRSVNEQIPGGEVIKIEINDLRGNVLCFAESDENFPETFTQRKNTVMQVFTDATKNPQLAEVLFNAANLELLQSMTALRDLYVPQVAARNKQLGEIDLLTKQKPVPNPQYLAAEQKLQQMAEAITQQGGDPSQLAGAEQELQAMPQFFSSIEIDAQVDDNDTEALTCWQFLNDPPGRKLKKTNPPAYENVRLHYLAHVQAAQAKQAGAGAGKPPSTSINYKDVAATDQSAAAQILQKAGIQPTPAATAPPGPGANAPAAVPASATPAPGPAAPIPVGTPGTSGGAPKH